MDGSLVGFDGGLSTGAKGTDPSCACVEDELFSPATTRSLSGWFNAGGVLASSDAASGPVIWLGFANVAASSSEATGLEVLESNSDTNCLGLLESSSETNGLGLLESSSVANCLEVESSSE